MNVNLGTSVSGRMQAIVYRKGEVIFDSGEQSNKILNGFFNSTQGRTRNQCTVGTGNQEPVNEDAGLRGAQVGSTQAKESIGLDVVIPISATSQAIESRVKYTFPLGGVIGTISEVVIHGQPSISVTYPALIRSLTKNSGGVATSITLTAEDQLVIYHTLRVVCTTVTSTSSVVFESTTYNLKYKFDSLVAAGSANNGWLEIGLLSSSLFASTQGFNRVYFGPNGNYAAETFTLTGGTANVFTPSQGVPSLSGNTFTRTIQVTIASNEMVLNNVTIMAFGNSSGGTVYPMSVLISPALNKTNLMQLKFNFTITVTRE